MEHLTDEGLKVRQPQGPGLTDRVGLAPAADARRAGFDREPYARRGIARRLCVNPLAPLRGGVGVGGGGSNSDVRACARRPYNAWFAATRVLRLRPPPRSAFQAESASSQGGGKASPALLQSERIML